MASSPSFRERVGDAAKQAGDTLGLRVGVYFNNPKKIRTPGVNVRWSGLDPTAGAARWELTVWWAVSTARDPDRYVAEWAQLMWRDLRPWCRIVSGPDTFDNEAGPGSRRDDNEAGPGGKQYDGFTLIVEDSVTAA